MLSGVLNSPGAITVNIEIMRAFVQMRQVLETHKELAEKNEELKRTVSSHDEDILLIFETIKQWMHKKNGNSCAGGKLIYKLAGDLAE